MRERTTVYLDGELHKDFKEICIREEESMSKKLEAWIARYVAVHKKGNPQTLLFTQEFQKKHQCGWVGCERLGSPSEMTKVKFISGLVGWLCPECLDHCQRKTSVIRHVYARATKGWTYEKRKHKNY